MVAAVTAAMLPDTSNGVCALLLRDCIEQIVSKSNKVLQRGQFKSVFELIHDFIFPLYIKI